MNVADGLTTRAIPVGDLATYHRNPRRGNVPAIAESLKVLGQYRPIVVNEGTHTGRPLEVLAGNHTLLAARDLGWPTIDVVTVDVDEDTATRIVAVDNRTSDLATNDDQALAALLSDLPDLTATGYSDDDLDELLGSLVSPTGDSGDADEVPDVPDEPVTAAGDLWQLGPHRLLCGDGTDPKTLMRLLDGGGCAEPGIVYTDPPYGISIVKADGKVGHKTGTPFGGVGSGAPFGGKIGHGKIVKTTAYMPVTGDETVETAAQSFHLLHGHFPDARHIWWGGNHYAASAELPDASCWIVWDKVNGATDFADAELAWTNHTGAVRVFRHMWNGMLRASERGKRVHPTQKPVALATWAFAQVDSSGSRRTVLDVFAGSGSTLMAAHETARTAYLIEVEPHYVDVICHRWQNATGQLPILEGGKEHDFSGG